jgi:hypothetical protein
MEQGLCRKEAERVRNNGYPVVSAGDGRYLVSRVMAKLITGEKPSKTIDHRDRDPLNNRRSNLRLATQLEQVWYTQLRKDNTSGFRGVSRLGAAQMTKGGVSHHLGAYSTPEEAAAAYELEARRDHGEFYCEPAYAASLKAVTPKRRLWRESASGLPEQAGEEVGGRAGGRGYFLGLFPTPEEAHTAYLEAKARLHPFQPVPRAARLPEASGLA